MGLICIGLVGLAGAIFLVQSRQAQQAAVPSPTAFIPTAIPTTTSTPPPTHTPTPLPTPTGTRVVPIDGQPDVGTATDAAPAGTPAPTLNPTDVAATAAVSLPTAEVPSNVTSTSTLVVQTPEETVTTTPTAPPAEMPEGGGVLSASESDIVVWTGVILLLVLLLFGLGNHFKSSKAS